VVRLDRRIARHPVVRFIVEASGVRRNRRRLESIAERVDDLRPVGDRVLDELADAEKRHWNSLPWPPLARSTRERKRRQGLPPRRMHATGLLERTLTHRGRSAQRHGQLARRGKKSISFGIKRGRVDIFYGRFHQKARGVPKRIVVPKPTAMMRVAVARIVLDHATEEAR
jgi:hypothetical protein